jgi:hypothetical protein
MSRRPRSRPPLTREERLIELHRELTRVEQAMDYFPGWYIGDDGLAEQLDPAARSLRRRVRALRKQLDVVRTAVQAAPREEGAA